MNNMKQENQIIVFKAKEGFTVDVNLSEESF